MSKKSHENLETRFDFLKDAEATIADRGKEYGTVAENFDRTALIWSAILGKPVTREQVALCMIGLKLARLSYDPKSEDGWVDAAGYAACGGEASKAE